MNNPRTGALISPFSLGLLAMLFIPAIAGAGNISLEIKAASHELRPGFSTVVWAYDGLVPGTPIVAVPGERMVIEVVNRLDVPTNIHWHGLNVPVEQDGPGVLIAPGGSHTYDFTVEESGTYWYHSHQTPVLEQMDMGLYGALIVKDPADSKYSGDHTIVLDDWLLDANGERLAGTARGGMERLGNVESVNGKTGSAVEPLVLKKGELHKLRFINASTAAVHTLKVTGHEFRVTHTDGHALSKPYISDTITLSPGERIDAEISATDGFGKSFEILSGRPRLGIRIPIAYAAGEVRTVASPFIPPQSRAFAGIFERAPDEVLVLNSGMGSPGSGGTMMSSMMGMMMGGSAAGMGMVWTINGKAYPNTDPISVKVGQTVKLRFKNEDTMGGHPMDHPIHLHGAYFQVVSIDGAAPDREIWKDTINVPAGKFVDIAFVMQYPGEWMLHCHIIDHEDNGMLTVVDAR
ncbi:MAG: multicopper oxidase family protein [Spirochaetota bacterium]